MGLSSHGMLVLVLLILGVNVAPAAEREPIYEDKPLRVWIKGMRDRRCAWDAKGIANMLPFGAEAKAVMPQLIDALGEGNDAVRIWAARVLGNMGPAAKEAAEGLAFASMSSKAEVADTAIDALRAIGPDAIAAARRRLTLLRKDPRPERRSRAAAALARLRPEAAIRELIQKLKEEEVDCTYGMYLAHALGQMGKPALDALRAALRDRDATVRQTALRVLGEIGPTRMAVRALIAALKDRDVNVRQTALAILKQLGPQAKEARAAVRAHLRDPDLEDRLCATATLLAIDPTAKPDRQLILAGLKEKAGDVHFRALCLFDKMEPKANEVLPILTGDLKDENRYVRECAAGALASMGKPGVIPLITYLEETESGERQMFFFGRRGPGAKSAVPLLLGCLSSEDSDMRHLSALALATIGPGAAEADTALAAALQDDCEFVVAAAAEALGAIGKPAALVKALASRNRMLRVQAALALGKRGLGGKTAISVLLEAPTNEYNQEEFAIALARIGKAALVPLRDALKHRNPAVRQKAAQALAQMGPGAEPAQAALIEALKGAETDVRIASAVALGRIGRAAATAVAPLTKALKDREARMRAAAIWALGEIGPRARVAVPSLIRALQDADVQVRDHAVIALGHLGPAALPALPALLDMLRFIERRREVTWALAHIGPGNKEVIAALTKLARDGSDETRHHAVFALGEMGPGSRAAVAPLLIALNDRDENVRTAAAASLGKLGTTAKAAVPVLVAILTDEERPVQRNVGELDVVEIELGVGPPSASDFLHNFEEVTLQQAAATALKRIDPAAARRAGVR